MTPTAWSVLMGVAGLVITILLFALQRLLTKLDARDTEIKVLTAALTDIKLTNIELRSSLTVLNRTLNSLPITARPEGHGT
jgi:hypothetical protein